MFLNQGHIKHNKIVFLMDLLAWLLAYLEEMEKEE